MNHEQHHCWKSDSGKGLSTQTHYDSSNADDGLKAEKGVYRIKELHNFCDNPEATTKVKDVANVGKGIKPAKNSIWDQNSPEKKTYFRRKPILRLSRKNKKSQKQNYQKNRK